MSTSYYRLKQPITHLRIEDAGGHDKIKIWVDHGLAGSLTVAKRDTKEFVRLFVLYEEDNECPLRTHWGGKERGAVVTVNDDTLADESVVVSEYGELLTVADVKKRDGARREDGFPTELFGYEEAG